MMDVFNPEARRPVMHASTFSENPLTMAAGLAAMGAFEQPEADRINAQGDRLRAGINEAFGSAGIRGTASGEASLSNILFTADTPRDARASLDSMIDAGHITGLFHLGLLRHGLFAAGRLMLAISTPMTDRDIDRVIAAIGTTLDEIKPVIAAERPALLH